METITLSLISHTNVGKTTVARTLLRRDIGEVIDQAHVTVESEAHTLIETGDGRLLLWDTPGFGDSARLLKRLRKQENPVRWILGQVWDRIADRPLWCSQKAIENIKEHADVILYLVNASELPEDAGYVKPELELLGWLEVPVLFLLNQTGGVGVDRRGAAGAMGAAGAAELEGRWRASVEGSPIVREVLPLDAFTRCWVEEGVLLERVLDALPEEKRPLMRRLVDAWNERNRRIYGASVERIARTLAGAATARRLLDGSSLSRKAKEGAMAALAAELEQSSQQLLDSLIAEHGLSGRVGERIQEEWQQFVDSGESALSPARGGVIGAVLGGATTGVLVDLKTGGASFGSGAIIGGVLGGLAGSGLGGLAQHIKTRAGRALHWSPEALHQHTRHALLRYLSVAPFGRGRGEFRPGEGPDPWGDALDGALEERRERFATIWKEAPAAGE
ncbi:MAG: DUF3482 domain-containing protein, partial [Planctomycetota bacterium]